MNHIYERSSWGLKCGIEEDELRKWIGRISVRGQSIRVDEATKNTLIKEDQLIKPGKRFELENIVVSEIR